MDELMKKIVMAKTAFIQDKNTGNIYYQIPGVPDYALRHDGTICYMANTGVCIDVIRNLSDCIFTDFDECCEFLKFFGCEPTDNTDYPDMFCICGIAEDNKVFDDLIRYARTEDVYIPAHVVITPECKAKGDKTLYRPLVMKEAAFNFDEINKERIEVNAIGAQILKGIKELPSFYRITGGPEQKLLQINMEDSSFSSSDNRNYILRWTIATLDIEHVKSIMNFTFISIDQVVFCLKIFGAKDVMHYTEEFTYDHPSHDGKKTYTRDYIRYFDKDDSEIILFCRKIRGNKQDSTVLDISEIV